MKRFISRVYSAFGCLFFLLYPTSSQHSFRKSPSTIIEHLTDKNINRLWLIPDICQSKFGDSAINELIQFFSSEDNINNFLYLLSALEIPYHGLKIHNRKSKHHEIGIYYLKYYHSTREINYTYSFYTRKYIDRYTYFELWYKAVQLDVQSYISILSVLQNDIWNKINQIHNSFLQEFEFISLVEKSQKDCEFCVFSNLSWHESDPCFFHTQMNYNKECEAYIHTRFQYVIKDKIPEIKSLSDKEIVILLGLRKIDTIFESFRGQFELPYWESKVQLPFPEKYYVKDQITYFQKISGNEWLKFLRNTYDLEYNTMNILKLVVSGLISIRDSPPVEIDSKVFIDTAKHLISYYPYFSYSHFIKFLLANYSSIDTKYGLFSNLNSQIKSLTKDIARNIGTNQSEYINACESNGLLLSESGIIASTEQLNTEEHFIQLSQSKYPIIQRIYEEGGVKALKRLFTWVTSFLLFYLTPKSKNTFSLLKQSQKKLAYRTLANKIKKLKQPKRIFFHLYQSFEFYEILQDYSNVRQILNAFYACGIQFPYYTIEIIGTEKTEDMQVVGKPFVVLEKDYTKNLDINIPLWSFNSFEDWYQNAFYDTQVFTRILEYITPKGLILFQNELIKLEKTATEIFRKKKEGSYSSRTPCDDCIMRESIRDHRYSSACLLEQSSIEFNWNQRRGRSRSDTSFEPCRHRIPDSFQKELKSKIPRIEEIESIENRIGGYYLFKKIIWLFKLREFQKAFDTNFNKLISTE